MANKNVSLAGSQQKDGNVIPYFLNKPARDRFLGMTALYYEVSSNSLGWHVFWIKSFILNYFKDGHMCYLSHWMVPSNSPQEWLWSHLVCRVQDQSLLRRIRTPSTLVQPWPAGTLLPVSTEKVPRWPQEKRWR